MKKVIRTTGYILLIFLFLVVAAVLLIQTEWAQNLIIGQVTKRLSKDLDTEVSIKKINIGFFDKLNLEGALIRDQKKDTLLYAGRLKLEITDWFFFKDKIELKYIGLENAVVRMSRYDSNWNYQFILDSLAPKNKTPKKKQADIQVILKTVDLKNVYVQYKDQWVGQDMVGSISSLELDTKQFDLNKKKIVINSLTLNKPSFYTFDYTGRRPKNNNKPKPISVSQNNTLQWNTEGWTINLDRFSIKDGTLSFERESKRKKYDHFDPAHILFTDITGTIKNLNVIRDTLSGQVDLKTKERSGFVVNRLKANMAFHPKAMIFTNLDIQTPKSRLRDYYAMKYDGFNKDMAEFITNVQLEASFKNSQLSSDDIAYFAPELKDLKKTIQLSGTAKGTIDNFTASNMRVLYGKNSSLTGNLTMKGLPDIEKTLIDFNSGEMKTTYADVESIVPAISKIKEPNLKSLEYIRFNGSFKGYMNNFATKGNLQTALGSVAADVKMQIPAKGSPKYAGIINTNGFNLGKLLGQDNLGTIAFNGEIKGQGFETSGAIDLKGVVKEIEFNGYKYNNVTLNGKLVRKEFTGEAIINDQHLKANLNGFFNLNDPKLPELNVVADIQRANLQALNFTKDKYSVLGKFKVNFLGNSIDDFIGEASLYDVALTKDDEVFVFDTLNLNAMNIDENRQIELKNADVSVIMNGQFLLSQVPATLNAYLSNYYPTYFKQPTRPVGAQSFTVKADFENVDQYLKLFHKKLSGFNYSSLQGAVNTEEEIFQLNLNIPQASFGKYEFQDFVFEGNGDLDSLRMKAGAGTIVINDSLRFPSTSLDILAAGDVSKFSISTSANQTINSANLSASITHLTDGVRIQFNPSTIVLNDKTWRIEKNGELTISKSLVDASEIRMTNGEQQILVSSIPSELGNSHDLIVELRKVNLGDILPFVLQEPTIEGITSGEITVEDPLNKIKVYVNAQTEQTRFENDSIGITSLNGYYDQANDKVRFNLNSNNPNYVFDIDGGINLEDSAHPLIDAKVDLKDTRISLLQTYLSSVFSKMDGKATGLINVVGNANKPELIGSVKLTKAGMLVDYTQVYYTMDDAEIKFKEGLIDIGDINITDPLGNRGKVSGTLQHNFFRNMKFDFRASSQKMLVMNTNRLNNDLFYGKVIGRVNFLFNGPEENMKMYITGAPVDSSRMTIVTSGSTSKQTGVVDYIVWREYGREMNADSLKRKNSNLSMDLDLSATNLLKMTVVLDPVAGDSITATGSGNLKILTGTNEALTMNGRFNIESGNYNFSFQQIFNKPFTVEAGSFISWTGDPYDADININAKYVAEKVRMSTLFEESNASGVSNVNSDVLREISDVDVMCNLTGTLSSPITNFQLSLPANSSVKNNPTIDNKIKTINRDQNEVSKQSTYLIVFKSFAPQSAIVTSDLNQELLNNTISGVINSILSNSVQNFFYKLFGSSVDVNFNYSRVATNLAGTATNSTGTSNTRENVSLEFIKSLVNNRLIITFGSDFNFNAVGSAAVSNQSFLFLPDVNVEYKITPDGKFRTSFFYRSSFDALSSSGRRDRTGGNISYRTEFDYMFNSKKKKARLEGDSTVN